MGEGWVAPSNLSCADSGLRSCPHQSRNRSAIRCRNWFILPMAAALDHDFSTSNHTADQTPASHEQKRVEPMPRASRKIGMIGVENHDVRPPVGLDRPDRLRKGLGPARERRCIEAMAGRFTLISGEYISRPMVQTLAVFEL